MSTNSISTSKSNQVEYKQTLTRLDLFGIAIGMIIGAGVMTLTGVAIGKTGRSVCISYFIATIFVLFFSIPTIFSSSCVRFKGGSYTSFALFAGEKWAGAWTIVYILGELSMSMYALSFAQYFQALFPQSNAKVVAITLATVFFIINYFGTDIMAKFQNVMTFSLIGALVLFAVCGLPHIQPEYFTGPGFVTNGILGVISAGAFLNYALMGATPLIQFSGECKNPKKDIPFVIIVSTLALAALFSVVSVVASGVLPVDQVANQPLTLVANIIFSKPLYIFFIVAGALFATATTLNASIGWVTKPLVQAAADGWLPKGLAKLHPKYRTPVRLLIAYYCITVLPIALNFSVEQIASVVMVVIYLRSAITAYSLRKLPDVFPTQWEKSQYRINNKLYKALLITCSLVSVVQLALMIMDSEAKLLIINLVVLVISIIFSIWRYNSGKVKMNISWDDN